MHCGMRQMEERHVANQVDCMVWSNRLDLLALSNFKGEVQIHRLHWQKVWNLPPPAENVTVCSIAWRPDGKALAVGYSSGSVYIIDVEDKDILDKYELEQELPDEFDKSKNIITSITWAVRSGTLESATEYNLYDDASLFLQKPAPSAGYKVLNEENVKQYKNFEYPTQLNMLVVGYGSGYIFFNVFGRYNYGTMHLTQITKDECGDYKILDIQMSDDFSVMQVVYLDRLSKNVSTSLLNTSVLSAYAEEIFIVTHKHNKITQLVARLDQTMTAINEAWEHILLEMDTKMAYYAASVPEGGVSADLLELLMLGVPSDELELFLLQELTAKGLKKFGSSVELSYSTIQKLVLKQLNIVGQHLVYYLAELRGLTRIPDRYKTLGLEEDAVTKSIRACCAFLNKSLELQQVIDTSMRNYKAFFRWLFVVIVRLLDEQTPSEIVKINQQELGHIAEFLYNFDNVQVESNVVNPEKPVKFNLERLGQYLQNQDLTIMPEDEDNPWQKFLRENTCISKDNDTIFSMSEFKKFSLLQQQNYLKSCIFNVFDTAKRDIGRFFSILHNIKCHDNKAGIGVDEYFKISQYFDATQQKFMMASIDRTNTNEICFMTTSIKENVCTASSVKYYFTAKPMNESLDQNIMYTAVDLQFYSSEYLSVLLQHPHCTDSSVFVQVPLKMAQEHSVDFNIKSTAFTFNDKIPKKNLTSLMEPEMFKVLEKMDGNKIAVSGSRKVAVVLSKTNRKVRVFEMEVDGEDEDDETLDTTPQSFTTHRSNNSHNTTDPQNVTNEDITS